MCVIAQNIGLRNMIPCVKDDIVEMVSLPKEDLEKEYVLAKKTILTKIISWKRYCLHISLCTWDTPVLHNTCDCEKRSRVERKHVLCKRCG